MPGMRPDKTRFLSALRPFSLVVALAGCGLAASLAWQDGYRTPLPIALVMLAGLLLQAAVNLVNDHGDLHRPGFDAAQRRRIRRNARIGWLLFALVMVIGLYLVSLRGWPLALLGLVGLAGAWGYAAPPLDYKSRGLGVPLVFLFMGVLFVGGAYYAITGHFGWRVLWLSLPFSLLASLLLLSNELRDLEADRAAGIRTLSVRLGQARAVRLYRLLLAGVYLSALGLYMAGLLPGVLALALTLPALWQPLRLLQAPPQRRHALTPLTGRLYALFSLAFLAGLWGLSP